jgi:RNA 2',3'-cyclic 3'-phosphodiesterase
MSSRDVGRDRLDVARVATPGWRLFLAIVLSDSIRRSLAQAIAELRTLAPFASPASLDAVHLTVHFLGQVQSGRVTEIAGGLKRAMAPFAAFELLVSGVGAFPAPSRPRVLWAGVAGAGQAELVAIHEATAGPLRSAGIELEDRAYAPHLTLGRVRRDPREGERGSLAEWSRRWQAFAFGALKVDAIHLMRSDLSARPPRYTTLETFALQ